MSAARWERLAADLAAAGVEVWVCAKRWQEFRYGSPHYGVERSIVLRREDGHVVEIGDTWWPRNPDVWSGWEVWRSDREGIVITAHRRTKKRPDVVAAVLAELRA